MVLRKQSKILKILMYLKTMLHYYLKCRKFQKVKTQRCQRQIKENQYFYLKVESVIVKNSYFSITTRRKRIVK